MAGNPDRSGPDFPEPEHVVTATGTNGVTPAFWDATNQAPVGLWESVDDHSGKLTRDLDGHKVTPFPDTGRWKQT